MIGQLRGRLLHKQPPVLLLDVQGVGYEMEAPMTTFYRLPEIGEEVILLTHLLVREDAQLLYAFATDDERHLFRSLIKISGIGAKLALTVLSGIEADDFRQCILQGDSARLVRLPGVGKKTAERLIVEMRDRLRDTTAKPATPASIAAGDHEDPVAEAISALVALGYRPQEASRHVHAVAADDMQCEELIRAALKASVR